MAEFLLELSKDVCDVDVDGRINVNKIHTREKVSETEEAFNLVSIVSSIIGRQMSSLRTALHCNTTINQNKSLTSLSFANIFSHCAF